MAKLLENKDSAKAKGLQKFVTSASTIQEICEQAFEYIK
jgi:hypothetical protein